MSSKKGKTEIVIPKNVLRKPARFWDATAAIDVDEVVLKFTAGLQGYVQKALDNEGTGRKVNLLASTTYYYHADPETGLTRDEEGFYIREFFASREFGSLAFCDGAKQGIAVLKKSGIQPLFITNVPGAMDTSGDQHQPYSWGTAQRLRLKQLSEAGLVSVPEDVIFCSAHRKPVEMTEKLLRVPILVDDRPSTLVTASEDYGLIAIGIRTNQTRYNQRNHEGIVWFNSLAEAVPYIRAIFKKLAQLGLLKTSTAR